MIEHTSEIALLSTAFLLCFYSLFLKNLFVVSLFIMHRKAVQHIMTKSVVACYRGPTVIHQDGDHVECKLEI